MEGVTSSILVAPTIEGPGETWGLRPFLGQAIRQREFSGEGLGKRAARNQGNASPLFIIGVRRWNIAGSAHLESGIVVKPAQFQWPHLKERHPVNLMAEISKESIDLENH